MKYSVAILIISDRTSAGERVDLCLPEFETALSDSQFEITESAVTSDDPGKIRESLEKLIKKDYQLIFTCGGTGCGPRDNTPEVSGKLIDKFTPGVDEALRIQSQKTAKYAIYSRGISGIAGKSLIVNLPGSPRAVSELAPFLLDTLSHPLDLIADQVSDCAIEPSQTDEGKKT